jgi:thioredoxin 1
MMGPIIEHLQEKFAGKLTVEVIRMFEHPELADKYHPEQLPTQVLLDANGDEVFRHNGFWTEEELIARLNEAGVKER